MSQIEINNSNTNNVEVQNTINNIDVNQGDYIVVVPQEITSIVEIFTAGPKGDKGEPGDPSLFTSSFISTASFDLFTSSYYLNSSSFDTRINNLTSSMLSGVENYLALFNTSNTISSSNIYVTESKVSINTTSSNAALTINSTGSENVLEAHVQNNLHLYMNNEGVLILIPFDVAPTAVSGGIFYSASNEYFLGVL